jgi:hypothetical protein
VGDELTLKTHVVLVVSRARCMRSYLDLLYLYQLGNLPSFEQKSRTPSTTTPTYLHYLIPSMRCRPVHLKLHPWNAERPQLLQPHDEFYSAHSEFDLLFHSLIACAPFFQLSTQATCDTTQTGAVSICTTQAHVRHLSRLSARATYKSQWINRGQLDSGILTPTNHYQAG